MKTKTIIAALILATAGTAAAPLAAQDSWRSGDRDTFWQGAPTGVQQRIEWMQRRIDQGVQNGTLDRREYRRVQQQLDYLRQQARSLDNSLDDLSRQIRWASRNDRYGDGYGSGYRDPYATDYDASRYYRDDPRYQERRLGPNDEIYRGSDGRYYCKRSDGTTGLVIGGASGALLGNVIDGGRNRVAGTLIGGALGALIGKSVDQNNSDIRCR